MQEIDAASSTVREALGTGRIGTPVAVRILADLADDHGVLERQLATLLEWAAGWFRSEPDRISVFGDLERGQLSALTRFKSGASALISVGASGLTQPVLELTIWGNHGILLWDRAHEARSLVGGPSAPKSSSLPEPSGAFLRWTRQAVASGRTIQIRDGRSVESGEARTNQPIVSAPARPPQVSLRGASPPFGVLLVAGDFTHQPNYAETFRADPRCRLIGVTDEADIPPRRRRLNEQFAQRLGIPLLPDLDEALHREDVQIVSICAEPERRGPIMVRAALAGKHLFLDKPLAASAEQAEQVVAAIREAGVVGQMWSLVHSGHAARLVEAVRGETLGELVALHQDLNFAKGYSGTVELGRPRDENASPENFEAPDSKRELTNVGVYPLVMLSWLTERRVRRVVATTGNYFFQEHQGNNMEDFGQMLLELEDGLVATISAGRTGWCSHPRAGLNRVSLIGRNGAVTIDADRPRLLGWTDAEPWRPPERDPEDPMGMWATPRPAPFTAAPKQDWFVPGGITQNDDIPRFLDCVEAGRPSDVPAELGADATAVLMAAYRSAASGEVVTLPPRRDR